MPISTITRKGQATIPKSIRNYLHVKPSDKIAFKIEHGKVILEAPKKELGDLFGKYHYKAKRKITVEEMNETIRRRRKAATK
ncbi:MAG: AbrB family transcriptional regulator [Chitinivibrionales bacterium]|nr:AbrB family transcriptional regulator [Chitinivibrionales bacterium]